MTDETLRVASNHQYPELTNESQGEWKENFIFIQAADTQFGLIDNYAGNPDNTRVWNEEIKLTKQAIEHANKMTPKPKFFVLCGDLVDDMPGKQHYEAQEQDFKKVFDKLDNDIPLICVCGNHDVGDIPTRDALQEYHNRHGDDYFTFWVGGVFFIVINSQFYVDHSNVQSEYDEQEKWIDEQLLICKSKKCTHCVMFQHVPWFIKEPNEIELEVGHYPSISKEPRLRMLKKIKDAGIKHVFSGHYHRNAGGFDEDLEMVVTSAIGCQIGKDKSGMRLVRVTEHKIDHKYYSLSDWPRVVDLNECVNLP